MTPVVIDASAGVELAADTLRGRALRALLPVDAVPWVPEVFYVECAAVLRRWEMRGLVAPADIEHSISELLTWPLQVVAIAGLFRDAWRYRANLTFPDAVYVALAEHLGAALLTADLRLSRAPTLPVATIHLP